MPKTKLKSKKITSRPKSRLEYLGKIRTKIPGGASITKYFRRKSGPKK